jgi:2-isopropylmalate synthase
LAAIEQGFTHVQGCTNGYGERCGNANLTTIIANLELKMGHTTIGKERLATLTAAARFIAELANLPMRGDQAYVGHSAFAHKGGVHVAAVIKESSTYEHVSPKVVGNRQRVLLSDLSGRGSILYKLKQHGLEERLDDAARRELLDRIKQMEFQGYELEAAEGTFELLVREALRPGAQMFEVVNYETTSRPNHCTATVTLKVQENILSATASGNGPVNALDVALRQCLSTLYPAIQNVRLTDYKVRVLDFKKGTAAKVRVLIEWSDHRRSWGTVGVSENVIEASWVALVDALRLELMRLSEQDPNIEKAVEDYCWGV